MFAKALLLGAFAATAVAQGVSSVLFFTKVPNPVTAGQPQAITFSTNDSTTPVMIELRKGLATNLKTIKILTSNANDGQYIWTPDPTLENASDYALQISQGEQLNYFGPFTLQGGGQASSSSSSSSSSASSSASSATSSHSSSMMIISPNSTMTTAHPPFATSNSTHHNTTMTSATRTQTSTTTSGSEPTSSDSAGFQTSSTSANPPANTNGAAIMATGSSAVALLFGAVAATLFY